MMASNISVKSSATGARQVSPTPARPNEDPRCCTACSNYTLSSWSTSHLFSQLCQVRTAPPLPKKRCREEHKTKSDIALQHNCDHSANMKCRCMLVF